MGYDKNGYYSLREIDGYADTTYRIILSERGIGKSWTLKRKMIESEGCGMCLYRTVTDLEFAVADWLDALISMGHDPEEFAWEKGQKDKKTNSQGACLLYRGVRKVWFRAITQVNAIKQEIFPDDMTIVWLDEFIPLVYKKLPGVPSEGDAIRAIVKTIEHDTIHSRTERGLKPVVVYMVANPFTWSNPILSYFHVTPGYGVRRLGPGVVLEMLEPLPKSSGGKQTVDDFLGDNVHRNQGWQDQKAFCGSWPKGLVPRLSIRLDRAFFGVYAPDHAEGRWFVRKLDGHIANVGHWGSVDGLTEDERSIEGSTFWMILKRKAFGGELRYFDVNTKFDLLTRLE